jgi:hypothetical protein
MTERKKELLALLPIEVKQSKELTTNAKLILANIIQLYGTDYAKDNKSCYRTNKQMMSDTQIKSENTIISCSIQLEQRGLISRVSGKRGEASTYVLNIEALNNYTSNRLQKSDCSNGSNVDEVALLRASVSEMKSEISNLKSTIEELKAAISSITSKPNCSTDTEAEIEEELYVNSNTTTAVEGNPNLRQCEVIDDIPFDLDEAETETISEVNGTESDKPIYVNSTDSENMSYSDEELRAVNQQAVEEWKMMEETRHQHISNQHKEVNECVGKKLSRGYDLLSTFRQTKKQDAANAYAHEINELIGSMNRAIQTGGITHNQAEAFGKFIDATNKAYDDKLRYFNRGEQIKKSKPQTALETEKTIIQQRGEETEKAAPRPTALTDADIQRMAKEANILFAMWDLQRLSELEEENKKTIEANGTPQQMNLYKRLTA